MSLRRRIAVTTAAVITGLVLLLLLKIPGAVGAFNAQISNSTNSISTAPFFTCTAASAGLNAAIAWPLDDGYVITTSNIGARDVSGNSRNGLYSLTGVAYRQITTLCPRDLVNGLDYGTILDGQSGYITFPTSFPLTNTFSESLWFSTTTTQGGRLIGFGNSATGMSSQYDRQIWMANDGTLTFGVCPAVCFQQVTSSKAYNDGKRHLVVATLGSNGMRMYVDGVQVAISPNTQAQTYATNAMYLRVGFDNLTNWSPRPASFYFQGAVRYAAYFPAALTAAQVAQLYAAGTGP